MPLRSQATISILATRRQALVAENASGAIFASMIEARRAMNAPFDAESTFPSVVHKPSLSTLLESLKWQHNLQLQSRSASVVAQVCVFLLQCESFPARKQQSSSGLNNPALHNQQASRDLLSKVLRNVIKYGHALPAFDIEISENRCELHHVFLFFSLSFFVLFVFIFFPSQVL